MRRFRDYHPLAKTAFFAVIFLIAMFSENPVVRLILFIGALAALAAKGTPAKKLFKIIGGSLVTILVMGPVNCLISHRGQTVLFKVMKLPITTEAFYYGLSAGTMIVGMAVWCICLTDETDTDDLVFTLGRLLPGVTSVITVTLRYIPEIIKKFRECLSAQKMLGVFDGKKFGRRALIASKIFMSVIERSIENAMDTAAAMRARGYGLRRRVSAHYLKWREHDTDLLLVTVYCGVFAAAGERTGALGFSFYPLFRFEQVGALGIPMVIACALLFMLPACAAVDGRIRWRKSFR